MDGMPVRRGLTKDLAVALALMALAGAAAEILHALLGLTRLSLLFIAAVTVAASIRGARAGLLAAVIGVAFYKFFLDLRTQEKTDFAEDVLNLLVFLIIALITGTLAGRMRDEAEQSSRRADRTELLLKTARELSNDDEDTYWSVLARAFSAAAGANGLVFDKSGKVRGREDQLTLDHEVCAIVAKCLSPDANLIERREQWSGRLIIADSEPVGVFAWQSPQPDLELEGVIELLAEFASASISRMHIRQEQVRVRAAEEAARLRETILSSISHDFRSPLSAIIGSATSLLQYGEQFEPAVRQDLLLNIQNEGEKLNDFVGNLLNMSRLQAGVIKPAQEVIPIEKVVRGAIDRLHRHKGRQLNMRVHGACRATADGRLLEQAIYNILDNAVKYASPDGDVRIDCASAQNGCEIVIADEGPGLSRSDQQSVFRKFGGSGAAERTDSTGLGLYIAKGFVEAVGGSILARDRRDGERGLEMVIKLPGAS